MSNQITESEILFFNIVPYSPGNEKSLADDIRNYYEKTGNDTVLYSLSLHPEGCPAMNKALRMAESYRTLKNELAGSGVKLGVLIQSILGHWPRVDRDEEPWTRSVNVDGDKVRYCILDENFRKYIIDAAALLAAEKPVFMLGDDDIRGFSPKVECFCEKHTALFNERTGNHFTPEEYREAVRNSVPGDAIHTAFERLAREIPQETASLIRQGIDSVDRTIPGGSCMPGWEYRFNNAVSKIFAAKDQAPVMRICNANYQEGSAKAFPYLVTKTMALRNAHKDIPVVLDESDTFPHTLYSRSAKSMHAKLCASIFSGLRGAKLWMVNMRKLGRPVHKNYTKILGKYHHFYRTLAAGVQNSSFDGIVIPASDKFDQWHSAKQETFEQHFPDPLLSSTTLGVLGIPFYCDFPLDQDRIYVLAGVHAVKRFSDEDLKTLLSGKLYVDGPAAWALCERGFASLLGVRADMIDFRYNREKNSASEQLYTISKAPDVPKFTLLDDKAQVLTELCYAPFIGAEPEVVSPATVIYRNEAGGVICSSAFHQKISFAQNNEPRKEWYLEIFEKLNNGRLPAVCMDLQDIMVLTRVCEDRSVLMLVCNLNFDELDELTVRCGRTPGRVWGLTPEGEWQECAFRPDGENIILECRLGCYDLAVFKLC